MFSGIIDAVGTVRQVHPVAGGQRLFIRAEDYWADVAAGASIAIDGVCLTVTRIEGNTAAFDVITETLRRTTMGGLRSGDRVNLQKSLAVGDRIDGHFVQGHVDAVATLARVDQSERESVRWFSTDPAAMQCIAPKGSVAIDGISLTVAEIRDDLFGVALIPTTLERTTLGDKRVGSRVNIETDILARTVVHFLRSLTEAPRGAAGPITPDLLARRGFDDSDPRRAAAD